MNDSQVLCPTIFSDRDGVINELLPGGGFTQKSPGGPPPEAYLHRWDQFEFCEGVIPALAKVFQSEYKFVVISNQSGISRWPDKMSYHSITKIFDEMVKQAELKVSYHILNTSTKDNPQLPDEYNHVIDGYVFCPHHPDHDCNCRKPKPGMIHHMGILHESLFSKSWMIGDNDSDVRSGWNAGICNNIILNQDVKPGIFMNCGRLRIHTHNLAHGILIYNFSDAIDFILEHDRLEDE